MGGCASKPRVLKDDDVSAISPEPQNKEVFAAADSTVVAEKKLSTDAENATKRRYPSTILTELSKPYRAPIYLTAQNTKSSESVKEKACEPSTWNTPEVQEPQQPNSEEEQTQHSVLMDSSDKQSQQVSPKTEKIPSQEFKTAMDDDNLAQNTIIPNETISGKKLYENVAEIITLMKPETITEEKKTDDESHLENIPKPETSSPKEKCQKSAENALEPEVLSGVSEKTEHKSTVNNSANLETAEKKTEEDQPSEEPTSDHNKTTMEKEIEEKQVEHPLMSEVVPSDEKTEQISKEENTLNPYFPQNDKTEPKPEEENNSDKPEKGIEENVLEGYTEKVRNDTEEENTQITGSLNVNKANGEEKEEEEPTKPLEKREAAQGKPNAQQQQPETITGEKENTAMLLDQLLMKEMEEKWIGG